MMHTTQNRMVARSRRITALGVLLAALVAAMLMAAGTAHASTTFTVTNTNDSGAGSLRQAILDANATSGADVINFDIPGTGVKTISPNPELPQITGAVTMDGYSQPGAQPNTKAVGSDAVLKIELSGASADAGTGLYITAANSTVKGLVINRWTHGIILGSSGATGNKIAGNYLGTDAMGTNDLGNDFNGVYVGNASGNTIGGATAGERNVISGNDYYGVNIDGQTATGNRVVGNYVGTDASGKGDLGNSSHGVYISSAPDNAIGSTTAGARNVISGNGGDGVYITGDGATGNRVLSNSIFSNVGQGIDLVGADGPTTNDPDDPDAGPNNLQNKPVLTSAKKSATGTTTVKGTLDSTPNETFKLQFFSNPKGTNEGKTLLDSMTVSTDGTGDFSFTFSTTKKVGLDQNITATATGPGGNTSEFSAPRIVVAQ